MTTGGHPPPEIKRRSLSSSAGRRQGNEGDMNHDEFDDGRCGMSRRCWRNLTRICIGLIAIYLLIALFVMEVFHD